MKIRYFADTDTALIEFSNESIVETKEISENLYIDLDGKGNLVSMTIERAKRRLIFQKYLIFKWIKLLPNKALKRE
ncbi:MAG: DUF2283 domain-containing protein [Planctomycetes bacterium]|nr:DUF2283 domain-containing protein [Planctomycetota bacterium]MBI4222387.1 DUF2283 domain-containing protein [Planctomycetota bacterium]